MSYISLADAKAFLFPRETTPPETLDAFITVQLDAVDAIIDSHCGQSFALSATETKYYDGEGKPYLFIDPLNSLTSIKYRYSWDPETWNDISEDDLILIGSPIYKLELKPTSSSVLSFPSGTQNIKIEGIWGYGEVPEPIKTVAKILLLKLVLKSEQFRTIYYKDSLASEGVPPVAEGNLWDPTLERLIEPYIRRIR